MKRQDRVGKRYGRGGEERLHLRAGSRQAVAMAVPTLRRLARSAVGTRQPLRQAACLVPSPRPVDSFATSLCSQPRRNNSPLGLIRQQGFHGKRSKVASAVVGDDTPAGTKRVVFLGTPEASSLVLRDLLGAAEASAGSEVPFEVAAVVTRPSKRKTHGKTIEGSPVASVASELGLPESSILSPASARDEAFLDAMRDLKPDLCVTAAYGNFLPQAFLDIPAQGTVNIHPSELPNFRGPAPVQRAMLRGDRNLCVTLAYTVLKMDAGAIVSQEWLQLGENGTSAEALEELFRRGSRMLVDSMPSLLTGRAALEAREQDDAMATHAPKLSKDEGSLSPYAMTAKECHDTSCALSVWPGTTLRCVCVTPVARRGKGGQGENEPLEFKEETLTIKVWQTSVEADSGEWDEDKRALEVGGVQMCRGRKATDMLVVCHGGTLLRVGMIQLPGKKPMQPKAFFNGRKGAVVTVKEEEKLNVEFNPDVLQKIAKADASRGINNN